MGILYTISDSTRQIRMIYYTLYQREWKSLKNIPLGCFTLYRPLVHGSISFLDWRKTKHLSVETHWNSSLLAWKHYYLGSHCFKSVAFELLTRAGRYFSWLALCKFKNVFPFSFTQFAYRFQCFLLNQVRSCLNVFIFIFWSFTLLRKSPSLTVLSWGFPLQKFPDIPRCLMLIHYRFIIPTSRFNRHRQFTKHMRIRKSIHLGSWILSVTIR